MTIIAFPLYTFAVIAGAIWAEAAWGRYWGWDPKETVRVHRLGHLRGLPARPRHGGLAHRAGRWVNVLGFAAMIFNLFFINIVVAGLHSYAGVN